MEEEIKDQKLILELTEKRYQPTSSPKIEKRTLEDGSEHELILGQGIVFEQRSEKLGGFFYEWIDKNAFRDCDMSDVVGLFNHDNNYVLGRSSAGTMRFTFDDAGVNYEIDAPETQIIRELVLAPMKRGDIRGSSFQFSIYEDDGDEWTYDKKNDVYNRKILRAEKLYDLSPVTMPAYAQTTSFIGKRSLDSFKAELKQIEERERQLEDHYNTSMAKARIRIYALS